jgi:hypothetical protein
MKYPDNVICQNCILEDPIICLICTGPFTGKHITTWQGLFSDVAKRGDTVSLEILEYFRDVFPPACLRDNFIQCGEKCDFVLGRPTYVTFIEYQTKWYYMGECHLGLTYVI